ncbi:Uncharacterised protein g2127 [Pycnogonum litorale]
MTYWRQAGLNYLQFSQIAARLLRRALKPEKQVEAMKREESTVKATMWKDGKPISNDA